MEINFNALEILEMAVKIEENGRLFYRTTAEATEDPDHRKLLEELAAWEDEHVTTFSAIRNEYAEQEQAPDIYDPDDYTTLYLQSMVEGRVFDLKTHPVNRLTGKETIEDILNMAIQFEKDAVTFYVGIKEMVPEAFGKDKVNHIIKEELGHIALLTGSLASLKK